jgi:hypothetical protein
MIREAIAALVEGRSLTEAEAAALHPEAQASAWAASRVPVGTRAGLKPGLLKELAG